MMNSDASDAENDSANSYDPCVPCVTDRDGEKLRLPIAMFAARQTCRGNALACCHNSHALAVASRAFGYPPKSKTAGEPAPLYKNQ